MTSLSLDRAQRLRRLAVVLPLMMLAGCASNGGDWKALYTAARDSWNNSDAAVPIESVAAIPYATIGFRVGDGAEQIVILAAQNDSDTLWTSAAKVALTLRSGRVVRTAGLAANLAGLSSGPGWNVPLTQPHDFWWTADFEDLRLYSVPLKCHDMPGTSEAIDILGRTMHSIKVVEFCSSDRIDWSFQNVYWVDPGSGRIWRSQQHVHPKMDALTIEVLRPSEAPN